MGLHRVSCPSRLSQTKVSISWGFVVPHVTRHTITTLLQPEPCQDEKYKNVDLIFFTCLFNSIPSDVEIKLEMIGYHFDWFLQNLGLIWSHNLTIHLVFVGTSRHTQKFKYFPNYFSSLQKNSIWILIWNQLEAVRGYVICRKFWGFYFTCTLQLQHSHSCN